MNSLEQKNAVQRFGNLAFFVGILMIAVSLPLSVFGMSLGQFFMAGGWLLSGDFNAKFKRLKSNSVFFVLVGLFLIHLVGLIHTQDFNYAANDIRIKIPLLLMPLFFFSMEPLTVRQYRITRNLFVSAVAVSSLISFAIYLGFTNYKWNNIRDISPFISHIRLSLLVCFCFFISIDQIFRIKEARVKLLNVILIFWFVFFLMLLESLTGIAILLAAGFLILTVQIFSAKRPLFVRATSFVVSLTIIFCSVLLYRYVFMDSIAPIKSENFFLPKTTKLGHPYTHLTERQDLENGNPVWLYYSEAEMDSAWRSRSASTIYERDVNGYEYKYSLVRFLASKGLTKDAEGVSQLSMDEIAAIKNGYSNYRQLNKRDFLRRIDELAWEYRQYYYNGNATGHSFTQRLEYWKTSLYIFKQHPLTGVGTGDLKIAFHDAYIELNSRLSEQWRLRSHNQYLSFGIAFGIFGIIYLLFALIYPMIKLKKQQELIYCMFLLTAMISMLTEDTLETQAGVTFFAFLNCLLLSNKSQS